MDKELLIFGLLMATISAATIPADIYTRYTPAQITNAINITYLNIYYQDDIAPKIALTYKYNKLTYANQYAGEVMGATSTPAIMRFSLKYGAFTKCLTLNAITGNAAARCYADLINGTATQTYSATETYTPIRAQINNFMAAELRRGIALQDRLRNETTYANAINLNYFNLICRVDKI